VAFVSPSIRTAAEADFPRMIPLINDAFAVETFLDGTRTDASRIAEMTKTGEYLIAEDEAGEIVASVYVELRGDRGYFGMLAVDPGRQGTGLGRLMVDAAEEYCRVRGCLLMEISVLSLRPELFPFYGKLGYVEAYHEPFIYPHRLKEGLECVAIIMSKPLH
jgi:GNAT superfamily N-acetyltransferase